MQWDVLTCGQLHADQQQPMGAPLCAGMLALCMTSGCMRSAVALRNTNSAAKGLRACSGLPVCVASLRLLACVRPHAAAYMHALLRSSGMPSRLPAALDPTLPTPFNLEALLRRRDRPEQS